MKRKISLFSANELMDSFPLDSQTTLQQYVSIVELEANDILFNEGERASEFYLVIRGKLQATSKNWELTASEIMTGRTIGEATVLSGRPYEATVIALEHTILMSISGRGYRQVMTKYPAVEAHLTKIIRTRLLEDELENVLFRIFPDLTESGIEAVKKALVWKQLSRGEILFEEGAPAHTMAILISGRLKVSTHSNHQETKLAELSKGSIIGEAALIDDGVRSATVTAMRDSHVVLLQRTMFEEIHRSFPELTLQITRTIVRRTQTKIQKEQAKSRHALNFVVLFLNDVDLSLVDAFAEQIREFSSAIVLDAVRFDKYFGQDNIANVSQQSHGDFMVARWLDELEYKNDYLLLVGDAMWDNWTQRIIRNADQILLIADATASPQLYAVEKQIQQHYPDIRQDLILLHPASTKLPSHTADWLTPRSVYKHHHMRINSEKDVNRVVRHLTGNANGLVLSGGGAVGVAHIGVLRALNENNIPVDLIGGTSMGALIAAAYSLELTIEEMTQILERLSDRSLILDWTFPMGSFVASHKINGILKDFFGDVLIEDLWIPFYCVSSDLTTHEIAYHDKGYLWRAVRTSSAVPVALSPMPVNNHLHVDGSIMNNFPVERMVQWVEGGRVLGVVVSPIGDVEESMADLKESMSGWRMLLNRLNPFAQTLESPSILEIFFRSLLVNSKRHFWLVSDQVDFLVTIDATGYGFLEIEKSDELIDIGYRTASDRIAEDTDALQRTHSHESI
jgi:predicted acylesterase/phospholipase RssA/CRP-like cAMP-binding protein